MRKILRRLTAIVFVIISASTINTFLVASIGELSLIDELDNKKKNDKTAFSSLGFLCADKKTMPQLYSLVVGLAKRLNIPVPMVLVFKGNAISLFAEQLGVDFRCNAFASALTQKCSLICIGEDLITQGFSVQELEAIIAHELSHIKCNHHIKSFIAIYALLTVFKMIQKINAKANFEKILMIDFSFESFDGKKLGEIFYGRLLFATIIGFLLKKVVFNTYRRAMEKEADLLAASIIEDPKILSDALYKIVVVTNDKPRFITWFWSRFISCDSHPRNAERKAYLEKFKKEYA